MNNPIRVNYFLCLAFLLTAFFVINSLMLLMINWPTIFQRMPGWEDEVYEWLVISGVGAGLLPLLLLAAWRISRYMLTPLRDMADTANRIDGGAFDERILVSRTHDEIAVLAGSVNRAFDRYADAVTRQRQFAGMASHQLRTPLTAIRSVGEVALQKERSPEEYGDVIGSMLEEAEHLSHVVEQLLLMSKMSGDEMRETFVFVSLERVLENVLGQYEPLYQEKEIAVSVSGAPGVAVEGQSSLLQQAVGNVLDNAIRHTPQGGTIEIQVSRHGETEALLCISDSGPGFSPFAVAAMNRQPACSDDAVGSGLGLRIVADIVRIHGGALEFRSSTQGGAQVAMRLPVRTHS